MADTRIIKNNPEYLLFIEGFDNPSIDVPVPKWQIIKDEYYGIGLHKVMTGEMDISEFLELIETEGNKILNAE
jgi:multiple sugar transport system substrate-binding protein